MQWLHDSGIDTRRVVQSDNKAWLALDITAIEAERLLQTEYYEHLDSVTGGAIPACDNYSVPEHVSEHVDYITPGIKLFAPSLTKRTAKGGSVERASSKTKTIPKRKAKRAHPHRKGNDSPFMQPAPAMEKDQMAMNTTNSSLATCDQVITPACIAALYRIPPVNRTKDELSPDNSMGIFESQNQYWYQPDLDNFYANFTPYIENGTHPIADNIDGFEAVTTNASAAGEETELDLTIAYPIVYPQTITVFGEDDAVYGANPNETYTFGFNTFLDAIDGSYCTYSAYGETGDSSIDPQYPDPAPGGYKGELQCGIYKPTPVISVSYGGQEVDVPIAYQKRQCNEYLKLGLQGVSILFASGDAGVGDYPAPYAVDGPTGCIGKNLDVFNPTWPNNCPYVTNVGGTKVYPGRSVFEPESAVFDPAGMPFHVNYSSGGGFSNVYPVPDYQQSAVNEYFSKYNPTYPYYSTLINDSSQYADIGSNGGLYNRIGRGIPDVAANGDNGATYVGGEFALGGGTSQATPIFSAIINRIVEERLAIGKGPLGFLNPAMYAKPDVFNDITNGTNPGCGTLGFNATTGWDPVTGLGTPNYPKMLEYLLSLP
ncbi:MAG: hypothetical protein Q9162_005704 [Coniocarpon cinnabarinum]